MARIAVFGAGYVGLVTGACFAELGHDVVVRDVLREKIDALRAGEIPIFEDGLEELVARNRERLSFEHDVRAAVDGADFLYVAVGTPPTYSGDADLSAVWTVIDELPRDTTATIVMKSTVPVGTGEKIRAALDARGFASIGYVSNPEFTAEGTAVRDFMHPDRIVVGAFEPADGDAVEALHEGIDAPVVRCDVNSAEMIKLAANAFLMTRISFINEIANVCEVTGADVVKVAEGVGLDRRLGPHFLRAGIGYGGSCLEGDETVLARMRGETRLITLASLFEQAADGEAVEIVSWRDGGDAPEFLPVSAVTRRRYTGDVLEVRTKMGRRVRCTPDHPLVAAHSDAAVRVVLADALTDQDWLPLALRAPVPSGAAAPSLDLVGELERAGISRDEVIVRPRREALAAVGRPRLRETTKAHPRGAAARTGDILRSGALRLTEAEIASVPLSGAHVGTARNGTYVPTSLTADEAFWRVVGLYIAEGHCAVDGRRHRLQWSFHPTDEQELVDEVAAFWNSLGMKVAIRKSETTTTVSVSSRILARWWTRVFGLARNCYEQRLPNAAWAAPAEHKRALLAGMWLGDGSWSLVAGGPSAVLEYGTASRELADGVLRLLGEFGIVARLKVGRTAKSTCDTYWIVVAGADQVERLLELVRPGARRTIAESLARQSKRIAPTGYRRGAPNTAWVRVTDVLRRPFDGFVYSVEVPDTQTFVTTGGLVVHNCFPKDSLALKQLASNSGYHFQLLSAVIEVNELQKRRVIQKLQKHLGRLRGKRIALLGLAFKPNTDDMREAPSLVLASRLLAEGAEVRAWDPVADARDLLTGAQICESVAEAVRGADAAVIVTEWPELKALASRETREAMARPLIVDGRNLLDPEQVRAAGFAYEGIGRSSSEFASLPETQERDPELST